MNRLLEILTSRWLQLIVVLFWIAALYFRVRWLLFASIGLAALMVVALLVSFVLRLLAQNRRNRGSNTDC